MDYRAFVNKAIRMREAMIRLGASKKSSPEVLSALTSLKKHIAFFGDKDYSKWLYKNAHLVYAILPGKGANAQEKLNQEFLTVLNNIYMKEAMKSTEILLHVHMQLKELYKSGNPVCYLGGPITGIPNNNYEAFMEAKYQLEQKGYAVLVPHDLFKNLDVKDYTHAHYMKVCKIALLLCQCAAFLPDWYESKGATDEKIECDKRGIINFLTLTMPHADKIKNRLEAPIPMAAF
jgi:hypothetical protein